MALENKLILLINNNAKLIQILANGTHHLVVLRKNVMIIFLNTEKKKNKLCTDSYIYISRYHNNMLGNGKKKIQNYDN